MGNLVHMAISSFLSDYQDLMQNQWYHRRLVITNGDDPYTIPRKSGKIRWTCTLNNLSSLFSYDATEVEFLECLEVSNQLNLSVFGHNPNRVMGHALR